MSDLKTTCRDCGADSGGKPRCTGCADAFRRSVDYRALGLERDGYWCGRCPRWRNQLLVADRKTGRLREPFRTAHRARWIGRTPPRGTRPGERPVQVDHIVALGNDGTHERTNLQVLCHHHHAGKTVRDIATMKGRRQPLDRGRLARWGLGLLAVLVVAFQLLDEDMQLAFRLSPANGLELLAARVVERSGDPALLVPLAALAAVVLVGLVLSRLRARTIQRLAVSVAAITGAPVDAKQPKLARRQIRVRRWGRVGRSIRPVDVEVRNVPWTFALHDGKETMKVQDRVASKLGWTSSRMDVDEPRDRIRLRYPDPFVVSPPTRSPLETAASWDLWDGVPVGIDENGKDVSLGLIERNLLLGGEPGAGKSNVLNLVLAAAALDRKCDVWGLDGKGVEFPFWAGSMERLVTTTDHDAAIELLRDLQTIVNWRYDLLADAGKKKIERGDDMGLLLFAVDELAVFTAAGDKRKREVFIELHRDVTQRGRACGVICVDATQRPAHDVVPTSLRDIIGLRWALRCLTPSSSDMVLGDGNATRGYDASRIPMEARGTGFLLAEGGFPRKLRAHYLPDSSVTTIAARAAALRGAAPVTEGEPGASID